MLITSGQVQGLKKTLGQQSKSYNLYLHLHRSVAESKNYLRICLLNLAQHCVMMSGKEAELPKSKVKQ